MRRRDRALIAAEWVGRTGARLWGIDLIRGVLLLLYYLALSYALIRVYGFGGPHVQPPFIYQGF